MGLIGKLLGIGPDGKIVNPDFMSPDEIKRQKHESFLKEREYASKYWKDPREIKSSSTIEMDRKNKDDAYKRSQKQKQLANKRVADLEKDLKIAKLEKELAELKANKSNPQD